MSSAVNVPWVWHGGWDFFSSGRWTLVEPRPPLSTEVSPKLERSVGVEFVMRCSAEVVSVLSNPVSLRAGKWTWMGLLPRGGILWVLVLVFVEFAFWPILIFASAPGPFEDRGGMRRMATGVDGWDRSLLYAVHQTLSLSFSLHVVQSQSAELPATTEGESSRLTSIHHVLSQGGLLVCLLMRLAPGTLTQVVGGAHGGLLLHALNQGVA